jgi:DNA-binding transcriptional LysR family regulator
MSALLLALANRLADPDYRPTPAAIDLLREAAALIEALEMAFAKLAERNAKAGKGG